MRQRSTALGQPPSLRAAGPLGGASHAQPSGGALCFLPPPPSSIASHPLHSKVFPASSSSGAVGSGAFEPWPSAPNSLCLLSPSHPSAQATGVPVSPPPLPCTPLSCSVPPLQPRGASDSTLDTRTRQGAALPVGTPQLRASLCTLRGSQRSGSRLPTQRPASFRLQLLLS